MLKANTTNPICHSINVKKVFDWISHSSTINLKVPIFIKQKVRVRPEQSSGDFFIDYKKQKSVLLWENSSCLHITGTITITNYSKDKGEINVFINENCLFSIKKNYSRSVTVDGIQSIYLTSNSKHNCSGRFVLKLNKKIKTLEYPKKLF
ncbi:S-Ena type endospore appendage [Priestia aryabhattai]